ncbi:hypothetical protein INS90_01780 [Trueperella pecoris]|uniref:Gram-positive cocci surface proteins LPxTG domain-containing protein n=1 Tax=Trueperella pecoris TaxID=2733571 RepID=A0A7M1R2X7_9ACTO|nr:hypothetical protein [Trueperella pecoris]QOR48054.1 hypothetical protein INS90_01780 [Trueperella pecoris]
MGRKIASAAAAALLIGGIITPSAASADDNSTWLLQPGTAVGPKPAGSPEGEPSLLDGDLSEWLQPGPAKPTSGKSPKDAQPSTSASSPFAKTDLTSWLATKPIGPNSPKPETRTDLPKPPAPAPAPASPASPSSPATTTPSSTPASSPFDNKNLDDWLAKNPVGPDGPKDAAPADESVREDLRPWLQPRTPEKEPEGDPQPGEDRSNIPVISELKFSESPFKRTLSWQVKGCSVLNEKTVRVSLKRGDQAFTVRGQSRTESTNASTWPAGTYTLTATCTSLDGKPLGTVTRDVTLDSSNMWVHYAGDPLYSLVPVPGDRVTLTTHAPANGLRIEHNGPYTPGEPVTISFAFDDATPAALAHTTADADGHIAFAQWLPKAPQGAKSFVVVARGETSKRQTTYGGTIIDTPRSAFTIANIAGRTLRVEPSDLDPNLAGFTKNSTVPASVLSEDGVVVANGELRVDEAGALRGSVTLPAGDLADGRYTLRVPTPLGIRGFHSDYFTVKNNQLSKGWDFPANDAEPADPRKPEAGENEAEKPQAEKPGNGEAETGKPESDSPETTTPGAAPEDAPRSEMPSWLLPGAVDPITPFVLDLFGPTSPFASPMTAPHSPGNAASEPEAKASAVKTTATKLATAKPAATKSAAKGDSKKLAHTGSDVAGLSMLGVGAAALGALFIGRRRAQG